MNWVLAVLLFLSGAFAATASDHPVFDLFGRPVNPAHLNLNGAMPSGELKLVIDPAAPRFGAKRHKSRAIRGSRSTTSPSHLIALASRPTQSVINVDQAVFATHLVKSGNRLILRHY